MCSSDLLGITVVFVTHDQEEAMALSHRIVVMNKGKFEQVGTPTEIYDNPATKYVASFIGEMNFVEKDGKTVAVRPEDVAITSEPADIQGEDVPPVRDYLKAKQKNGSDLCAEEIFRETWLWLKARGCEMLVNNQLIEQYAMSVARWIQCEEAISEFGYLAKHPTTGNAIASPYVSMSRDYKKKVNADWVKIYQIVRENCSVEYDGASPQDDLMERLL